MNRRHFLTGIIGAALWVEEAKPDLDDWVRDTHSRNWNEPLTFKGIPIKWDKCSLVAVEIDIDYSTFKGA